MYRSKSYQADHLESHSVKTPKKTNSAAHFRCDYSPKYFSYILKWIFFSNFILVPLFWNPI